MGAAASVEGENNETHDPNEDFVVQPPDFLPNGSLMTDGDDLLLAVKMGCLCQLSYNNSSLTADNQASEQKWLNALHITDYKIWDDVSGEGDKKSIDSQALSGVIELVSNKYTKAMPFVCFRGTKSTSDMLHDLASLITVPFVTTKKNTVGTTGLGFEMKLAAFKKLGLIEEVMEQVRKHSTGLLVTGHSLGGAVTCVFTAEILRDYHEVFELVPLIQVTFGAPRVFDKKTALSINSTKYHNLRFANEKDIITTLPHWHMKSLYHVGDCCFAVDGSRTWHTIKRTTIEDFEEDQEDDNDDDEDLGEKAKVMTNNHRRFNFAGDGHLDSDSFADVLARFTIGSADTHAMAQANGYLDQIVNSKAFKHAVARSGEDIKATFTSLPIEIAKASAIVEIGTAVSDMANSLEGLFD